MKTIKDQSQASFTLKTLLGLAAAGIILYFMSHWSVLINNLFIAYIVAILAAPLLGRLRARGLADWLSFLLTLLAVSAVSLLVVGFILFAAGRLSGSIPSYIIQLQNYQEYLDELITKYGLFEDDLSTLLESIQLSQVFEFLGAVLGAGATLLSNAAMIILFVIFMLLQIFTTPRLVQREIDSGNAFMLRIRMYNHDLRQYILITAVIAVVTGALDTALFFILGIPDPLVWGIVAAILSFVPTIGFWLAAIPPTLLALLVHNPLTAVLTLLGIVLINGFADNVIKPRYLGSGLDMAPFLVVFSVVFWAAILGPVGAILGVPMTMLVKSLFFEADESLSWVARVMGSGSSAQDGIRVLADTSASGDGAKIE